MAAMRLPVGLVAVVGQALLVILEQVVTQLLPNPASLTATRATRLSQVTPGFNFIHFISQAIHAIQTSGLDKTLFYQGVNIIKSDTEEKIIVPNINSDEEWISSKDYFLKYFERNYFSHMSTLYNRQLAIKSNFYKNNVLSTDIFSFLSLCLNFDEKKVIVSKNISGVWLQHNNNISKTLHLRGHWNNFGLYIKLYKLAAENEYGKV